MELVNYSNEEIFKLALRLYYNPSIWCKEFSKMSTLMITNIGVQNVNSLIERGIIASFSFFIDQEWKIVVNENDFVVNLQPTIPLNWRNAISTVMTLGVEHNAAGYFVRKKNQTFYLTFASNSCTNTVAVSLIHLQNHRTFQLALLSSELEGLNDPEHRSSFAMHIMSKFMKVMKYPMKKADQDLPPSSVQSPV